MRIPNFSFGGYSFHRFLRWLRSLIGGTFARRTSRGGKVPARLAVEALEERVVPTNTPPVALNDGPYSMLHGQTSPEMYLLANDSDAENNPLEIYIVSWPSHGYLYEVSNGVWAFLADTNYAGSDSFTYRLFDGQDYGNTATVSLTVTNTAPVAINDGAYSVLHGQMLMDMDLLANDSDADDDPLEVEIVSYPSHGYLTGSPTGPWAYLADTNYAGSDSFTYRVFDGQAYSNTATVTINVTNAAPLLQDPGLHRDVVEDVVGLTLSASDPDGDDLTFSADGLPPGLYIDTESGHISGTIDPAAISGSPYSVTVTASDGAATASRTFSWVITSLSLANPGAQHNLDSDPVLLALQARSASEDPLTFSASGLPDGLDIDPDTGLISGTIAATADTGSPYTVTVGVSDGTYSASQTFPWYVSEPAPPSLESPGDQIDAAGDEVSLQLAATGPSAAALAYSATGLPDGLEIDPDTGLVSGTLTDEAASDTPYEVTATVTDGTNTVSQTFLWTVRFVSLGYPGTQFNEEEEEVSLGLQAHSASGPPTFSASGLPDGLDIDPDTGLVSGTIAEEAGAGSPYAVTVTASDGTHSASQTFVWYVGDLIVLSLDPPGDQVSAAGDAISLLPMTTYWDTPPLTYSATGLPDGLDIDADTGLISGTLADEAASATPYEVTVSVTVGSNTASQTFEWTVHFIGLENPSTQFDNAGDVVSLPVTAHGAAGPLTFSASGLPDGLDIDPDTGLVSGTIATTADTNSPYTVTLTASDGTNSANQNFSWHVSPLPTLALDSPGDQFNAAGDEVELQLWATAPSSATLTYSATSLPDGLDIDPETGFISGTIADEAASDTPYEVTSSVSDGTSTVSRTFDWVVHFVRLESPGTQWYINGDVVLLPMAAYSATGRRLTFGASGLPDGLEIDPETGLISGTIAEEADANSPYTATVTASDGMHSAIQTFQWTVLPQSVLRLAAPGDQANAEDDVVSLQLEATYAGEDPLTYSADGLPDGLDIDPDTGLISGTLTSNAVSDTPYLVTVTVTDLMNSASQTFAWRVTEEGAPLTDVPGDILDTARPVEFDESEVAEVADEIGNNSHDSRDVDLYRVELAEGDWLTVTVQAPAGVVNDPNFGIMLRIFDASGNELAIAGDGVGLQPGESIDFTAPADGTYYVGVSYHGNSGYNPLAAGSGVLGLTGAYALTLSYLPAADSGPTGYETIWHHLIPQEFFDESKNKATARLLKKRFGEDYIHSSENGWYLMQEDHILVHSKMTNRPGGGGLREWNDEWEKFFKANPNAEKKDILAFLEKMKKDYGLVDSKGKRKLGAAVAETDKLTYPESRKTSAEKATLRKERGVKAWTPPRAEQQAAVAAYQERRRLKQLTDNTKAAVDAADPTGGTNKAKKGRLSKALGVMGAALALSGPAEAAANFDMRRYIDDLRDANTELAFAHQHKNTNPELAKTYYINFMTKIKNIMVTHLGYEETIANFLVYMVDQGILGDLIPLP